MRDSVCFYLNGARTEVRGDDVFLSLSDFLRRRRGLTGTKVVCAEGDCGSCAALIGRLEGDHIRYAAVTSCIQLVLQMDAAHVVTVEGLRQGSALNPIQQAMVTCQGTQCGFCTPGFVVAMQDLMQNPEPLTPVEIRRGLTGNLCRCTGYDSIVRAAMTTDRAALKCIDQLYPPADMIKDLQSVAATEVRVETIGRLFYKPTSIETACRFRQQHPESSVVAGATDLGVVYNKRLRELNVVLALGGIEALRRREVTSDSMRLGSGVTLTDLASMASSHLPELGRFMEWFGSRLIRNAGTVGGNLVTGSPIGDTIPAMTVLCAEVEITGPAGVRSVPIGEFYIGYRKTILGEGDLLTGLHIPLPEPGAVFKLYKVSRRKDLDISTFSAAIWMRCVDGRIEAARLAFGGVGPMVLRMCRTEATLLGQPATLDTFERAAETAADEVTPIGDVRGSADYRRTLAGNILLKFWHEAMGSTTGEPAVSFNTGGGNGDGAH